MSRPSDTESRRFDSTVPAGGAPAVYLEALAGELNEAELEHGIAIYSRRSATHGAGDWLVVDVIAPAPLRLYRARTSECFVLDSNERRISVELPVIAD